MTKIHHGLLPGVKRAALAALFLCTAAAQALGPHECVILVNKHSPDSIALANYYADLRKIPAINVLHLDLPDHAREAAATFTPEEFRQHIYDPVIKQLTERKISSHILAWLYSLDFPHTISTTPPMSLTGMTLVRGNPPSSSDIQSGTWISPLYRGPDRPDGPTGPTLSLEQFTLSLTTNMPVPSMMLGWSGSRGMTLEEIKQQLRMSAAGDGTHPSGTFFFEINEDIRSKTRQWQFEPAIKELASAGITALADTSLPTSDKNVMGVLAGHPELNALDYGTLRPGAYADHLTSFGALFHSPEQTKMIEWLRRGAAGSSGTINEPGSLEVPVILWAKFPGARLFHHYTQGATLLESLFQSTRSPSQILFIGDALAAPWSKAPSVTLIHMTDDDASPVRGLADFAVSARGQFGGKTPLIMFLLNGRPIMLPAQIGVPVSINTTPLNDGHHELRAIAYGHDSHRYQGFATKGFVTQNHGTFITLTGPANDQSVDLHTPLALRIEASEAPDELAIIVQERIVLRSAYTNGALYVINPSELGAGFVSLQAAGIYDGRKSVISSPLRIRIERLNRAPQPVANVITNDAAAKVWRAMVSFTDPEQDTIATNWWFDLLAERADLSGQATIQEHGDAYVVISRSNGIANLTAAIDQPHRIDAFRGRVQINATGLVDGRHQSGLVFNAADDDNYMFWGMDGNRSAWALKRVVDGKEQTILTRGAPIRTEKSYELAIRSATNRQLELYVDQILLARTDAQFGPGRMGIRAGEAAVRVSDLVVAPASAARNFVTADGGHIVVPQKQRNVLRAIRAAGDDGQHTTLVKIKDGN